MSRPVVIWVREKDVHIWLPWVTRYLLRNMEHKGTLQVRFGWPMYGDVWRRRQGAPRWYNVNKLEELFCTNQTDESLSINENINDNGRSGTGDENEL